MRGGPVIALVALALAPASTAAATLPVNIEFQDFAPSQLDLLPGETVEWDNGSVRTHTVTADDGSFDSSDLAPGDKFTREFDSVGTFAYHCTIHAGMVGEIDVRRVTLDSLPPTAVPAGNAVEVTGRTSDPSQPVQVQLSTGADFKTVASATPAADGSWKATVPAQQSGDYRAAIGSGVSETRHLLVSDRKVLVRATRRGIAVTVTPSLPYARVLVEERLRERFGWWPVKTGRLDYVSQASFRLARTRAPIRVVLVERDGWTAVATSLVVHMRARK